MKINNIYLACLASFYITASMAAQAQTKKMDICHMARDGQTIVLNLPLTGVNAHLGHGDILPDTLFEDFDGDGFGNPEVSMQNCDDAVSGFVDTNTDLNDTVYNDTVGDENFGTCQDGVFVDSSGECTGGDDLY
jgi:hypothetical protein